MAKSSLNSRILLDVGISFGDEGKGRLIPEIIRDLAQSTGRKDPVGMVLKVNGGANSGHTSGGLKLNLFPAGVIEESVTCLGIGSGVVADPRKFLWELAYIEDHHYEVRERLLIDRRTMVSDLAHRLLDLSWEFYRHHVLGETPRGSTGRGISPAYCDETGHFPLYYAHFEGPEEAFREALKRRTERALDTIQHVCRVTPKAWDGFFETLTRAETRANEDLVEAGRFSKGTFDFHRFKGEAPFTLNLEALSRIYWEAGQELKPNIGDVREAAHGVLQRDQFIIGEFGQAFWLDKRFGFPPNVTASHTLPAEFFLSAGVPLQQAHVFGVCKAYDTKVGTHNFICEIPEGHPLGDRLRELEFGTTTGRQRMVGWYDAVEKGDAIRYGGADELVINKLDALTYGGAWQGGELLICVAYRLPDGSQLQHVPRDPAIHNQAQPVYLQTPGWAEDISRIRTFDNLPLAAKRYVALMMKATLQVAYGSPASWPARLPQLRFVGVGPDPEQIIDDVPETRELLSLVD